MDRAEILESIPRNPRLARRVSIMENLNSRAIGARAIDNATRNYIANRNINAHGLSSWIRHTTRLKHSRTVQVVSRSATWRRSAESLTLRHSRRRERQSEIQCLRRQNGGVQFL
jgi:hypothetical protein